MNITQRLLTLTLAGGDWILRLLLGLGVVSLAIIVDYGWHSARHAVDVPWLASGLRRLLAQGHLRETRGRPRGSRTAALRVEP